MIKSISVFAALAYATKLKAQTQTMDGPVNFWLEFNVESWNGLKESERFISGSVNKLDFCAGTTDCKVTLSDGRVCPTSYTSTRGGTSFSFNCGDGDDLIRFSVDCKEWTKNKPGGCYAS